MALQQRVLAKLCDPVQGMELLKFRRGCHLYSAGQPSCFASAHILVCFFCLFVTQISHKWLNGLAPNLQRRRVWSLARQVWTLMSNVKGLGHQGQKKRKTVESSPIKTA